MFGPWSLTCILRHDIIELQQGYPDCRPDLKLVVDWAHIPVFLAPLLWRFISQLIPFS